MRNSHAGAPATPFCIPGGHIVDPATSWLLVRMSNDSGLWLPDPTSPAKVVACTAHQDGEPKPRWLKEMHASGTHGQPQVGCTVCGGILRDRGPEHDENGPRYGKD